MTVGRVTCKQIRDLQLSCFSSAYRTVLSAGLTDITSLSTVSAPEFVVNQIKVLCSVDARVGNWSRSSFPKSCSGLVVAVGDSLPERLLALFSGRLFCRSELHSAFLLWSCQTALLHQAPCWQEHLQPREPPSSVTHFLSPFLGLSSSIVLLMASQRLCRASAGALLTPQRASCRVATRSYSLLRTSRLASRNTPCPNRPALVVSSSKWANTTVILRKPC
jgi:hypothetical protein